jgi:DNA-binding SARP family transcriptional activator
VANLDEAAVELILLGRFELRAGGLAILDGSWPRRKAQALLKLLALQPGRSLHRERVYDLLWPDSGSDAGANNLRQNLHHLRRALTEAGFAADVLSIRGEQVVLANNVAVDLDAFRSSAAEARHAGNDVDLYEQAIGKYSGDLLPDDLYEPWTEPHRDQLRELYHHLLLDVSRLYEGKGHLDTSVFRLRDLLRHDAANESAHRGLMRAYTLAGLRDRALRQYQEYRDILRSELDVDPSEEVDVLYRDIVEGRLAAVPGAEALRVQIGNGTNGDEATVQVPVAGRGLGWRWVGAAAVILALVAGAVLGSLAFTGALGPGGSSPDPAPRELDFQMSTNSTSTRISGDCQTEGLVYASDSVADVSSGLSGRFEAHGRSTLFLDEGCRVGSSQTDALFRDVDGNSFGGYAESAISLTRIPSASASTTRTAFIFDSATGTYEGLVGSGFCAGTSVTEIDDEGTAHSAGTSECQFELVPVEEALRTSGVAFETASSSLASLAAEDAAAGENAIVVGALFTNLEERVHAGLTLRLIAPTGTRITARAVGEQPPEESGELMWSVADLAPASTGRAVFVIEFLSAEASSVPLVFELDGEDFAEPLRSSPINIEIIR